MSSPTKKRKLNADSKNGKPQSKGLEYFFSKQKSKDTPAQSQPDQDAALDAELTDEQLARKLQDEWDKEAAAVGLGGSQSVQNNDPSKESAIATQPERLTLPINAAPPASQEDAKKDGTLKLEASGMAEDTITTSIPLDESPLTFEPRKYVELLKQHWEKEGGDASYALLTTCFVLVSGTSSRIKIVDTLVNCLRILIEGDPDSLLPAVSRENGLLWHMC